jgi:hypothetical protein
MKIAELRNDKFYDVELTIDEVRNYKSISWVLLLANQFDIPEDPEFSILYHPNFNRIEIVSEWQGSGAYEVDDLTLLAYILSKYTTGDIMFRDSIVIVWGKDSKSNHRELCNDIQKLIDDGDK